MDAADLIRALEEAGYEPRSYSGRGMYGKSCVGCELDADAELWTLACEVSARSDDTPPRPHTDSLGLGLIVYWPRFEWPAHTA